MSEIIDVTKNSIGNYKFMQNAIIWQISLCAGFDLSTRYIMSIIVSNCQHCDEQQFQTLSCVHYTIFSVVNLGSFIRVLILDCILALEKTTRTPHVHLAVFDTGKIMQRSDQLPPLCYSNVPLFYSKIIHYVG